MNKFLFSDFQKTEKFNIILDNIYNQKKQLVYGMDEESLVYLCCNLNNYLSNKILVVTSSEFKGKSIHEIIKQYCNNSELFVPKTLMYHNVDALSKMNVYKRVNVIDKIINSGQLIVTASVESCLNKVMSKEIIKESILKLEYNKEYNFNHLISTFVKLGYERVDIVEEKGQYSLRGGIIDIFSVSENYPYRVEFFGDEIDSIRIFDTKNQRSIDNISVARILPTNDIFFDSDELCHIKNQITKDYNKRLQKLANIDDTKSIVNSLVDLYNSYNSKLDLEFQFGNNDLLVPYLKDKYESIIDYFDENSLIILIEPDKIYSELNKICNDCNSRFKDLFEKGLVFTKQSNINYKKVDFLKKLKEKTILYHNSLMKQNKNFEVEDIVKLISKSATSYYGKIEELAKDLVRFKKKNYKILLCLSTDKVCKKLNNILNDYNCSTILSIRDGENLSGQVVLCVNGIKKGFELTEEKILVLTENEVFGTTRNTYKTKKRSKIKKKNIIESFSDLKVGDYVVHEYHGIGQYIGIEEINVQNIKKDYLCVKYKGNDKLYVPVDQLSLIQKYIGADTVKPKVNKLSNQEWVKVKRKTQKAIEEMAGELLELYARRKLLKGYAFSNDTEWQRDFEYKFPFEETNDQLRCIEEIKSDMEKPQPMDRLLCGDVGFGKTEVALRAIFKAVMDGKQVAILVPTTILAQQHYTNIVNRFRGFPIKAEMLSRFRTSSQQRKIIEDSNKGLIDIVVGTHKILSKDLKFRDLGLLVIDEEQRFGVRHKEKIKKLKANIDVLTLSATPIPRTLHMSMIGIRDMSLIEEPPGDRMLIQTFVIEQSDVLVKDAIEKELLRDGQVYYVHNRVTDIESVASKIRRLVPTARIVVGHGQMNERELENVMLSFVNKEYDVLVSTTIIETGMDIPNANTLIIDNADNFGLSQLYQLRGRVGRSNRTSFAYLMYDRNKVLSEIADKRLKAIKEFTEFGSGFKIAMRDLEIRGCGNILGSEQHGHMIAIGYDLYVKFLDRAVKKLSGENIEEEFEVSVDLNVNGFIPSTFIRNEEHKIEIYKKIAAISNKDDIYDITEEIIDRYGSIPNEVNNLIKISYLKVLCKKLFIINITQISKIIKIEFKSGFSFNTNIMNYLLTKHQKRIKFDISKDPIIKYTLIETSQNKLLDELENLFLEMISIEKDNS